MSETQLQSRIRKKVLTAYPGSFMFKVHGGPMQAAGIPDLVGCVEGRFVGLEVKLPDGDHPVSEIQKARLAEIRKAGGIGAVVTSEEDAVEILEVYLGERQL